MKPTVVKDREAMRTLVELRKQAGEQAVPISDDRTDMYRGPKKVRIIKVRDGKA